MRKVLLIFSIIFLLIQQTHISAQNIFPLNSLEELAMSTSVKSFKNKVDSSGYWYAEKDTLTRLNESEYVKYSFSRMFRGYSWPNEILFSFYDFRHDHVAIKLEGTSYAFSNLVKDIRKQISKSDFKKDRKHCLKQDDDTNSSCFISPRYTLRVSEATNLGKNGKHQIHYVVEISRR